MEISKFRELLYLFLNSSATKSMLGDIEGVNIIKEIKVIVPEGSFYHPPLYITIITNTPELWESTDILLKYNLDGRFWEDSIIPDILEKYFPSEIERVTFVKIITQKNQLLFPESWTASSQYNNF
jgi:hypothetical protein